MRVIPSIDLMNGKCVRLIRGEKQSSVTYDKDPLDVAREYYQEGYELIHVVDLDGAFTGKMENFNTICQLAKKFPIQVGGGIRSEDKIKELLKLRVKKIIVSSLLFDNQKLASKLKEKYYGKLIGSFDFKESKLSYAGWTKQSNVSFEEIVKGLDEIIVTDVERDGTLTGPNLELLRSLKARYKSKIIAAGGVRNILDFLDLKRIGINEVIVGKAFLENRISLRKSFKFQMFTGD